ncbi:TPA: hypothetical protein ACH3X3_005527 [Trebouxia sp. C0006]
MDTKKTNTAGGTLQLISAAAHIANASMALALSAHNPWVHQALHKIPQARHVFDEAKQRFGQHFTTGVPLDKCVAQCVMMLLVQQSLEGRGPG